MKRVEHHRADDLVSRRRRRTIELLRSLGLQDEFLRLPHSVRERIHSRVYPSPAIELDASCDGIAGRDELPGLVLDAMRLEKAEVPGTTFTLSTTELVTVLLKLVRCLRPLRARGVRPDVVQRLLDALEPVLVHFLRDHPYVPFAIDSALIPRSRFDGHVLHHRAVLEPAGGGRVRFRVRIGATRCRRLSVHVDGAVRTVFHCYGLNSTTRDTRDGRFVHWVEWSPAAMTGSESTGNVPVYVQGHAIDHMLDRLGVRSHAGWPLDGMYAALRWPVVARAEATHLLVAQDIGDDRVGYYVVTFHDTFFLVRTFLFLTMCGTPEADALYRLLRTSRHGVETMRLDRLQTFLNPTLRADAQLAAVLDGCGCGHLLRLAASSENPQALDAAQQIRRYLGWQQRPIEMPPEAEPDEELS
jgi:hypothetical protein